MYDVLQKLLNEKYGESYKAVYLRFKRFIFAYRVISPQIYFKLKKTDARHLLARVVSGGCTLFFDCWTFSLFRVTGQPLLQPN